MDALEVIIASRPCVNEAAMLTKLTTKAVFDAASGADQVHKYYMNTASTTGQCDYSFEQTSIRPHICFHLSPHVASRASRESRDLSLTCISRAPSTYRGRSFRSSATRHSTSSLGLIENISTLFGRPQYPCMYVRSSAGSTRRNSHGAASTREGWTTSRRSDGTARMLSV